MRVVLTAFGTAGDVEPILGLGVALQRQGDDAVVVTNPYFEQRVRSRGLGYRGCGERWDPSVVSHDKRYTDKNFGPFNVWKDIYRPLVGPMYEATAAALAESKTTAVLNHIWCFGGYLAAEAAEVPTGMVSLAPLTWYSSEDPSLYGPTKPPAWMHGRLMAGPMRWMMNGFFSRSLRGACRELGVRDHRALFFDSQSLGAINLGLWSPTWRPEASDDPPHAQICGFPWGGDGRQKRPLDEALETFLDAGEPPGVLGLGAALPAGAQDIYRAVAEACTSLGCRAVLVGGQPEALGPQPEEIMVVDYAPYVSLFERASVVVHHAGIGTLAEVLCAGKPGLAVPFGNDQYDNAWRAHRLGVSQTMPRDKVTAKRMTRVLGQILEDAALQARAAEVGRQISAEPDGAQVAAKMLRLHFVHDP